MATDITVHLDDRPGELAALAQVLGAAGVNIDGFCAVTSGGGRAEVHVLIEDMDAAFACLAEARIEVSSEQEVMVVDVDDAPGVLGDVARSLGDADVNISLAYLATRTRLVVAADDLAVARSALDDPLM
jgi:hypothetical protein